MHMGNFSPGEKVYYLFATVTLSQVPITFAGTPALRVYKDDSDAQDTDGITLNIDFDGVTGQHRAVIDTSADGTFYAAGHEFHVVVQAGTVDGISLVGSPLFSFSLSRIPVGATAAALATLQGDVTALAVVAGSISDDVGDLITAFADLDGRVPDALVAGNMKSDVKAINASAAAAVRQALAAGAIIPGTAVTGTLNVNEATTDLAGYTASQLIGRVILFLTGPATGEAKEIIGYTVLNGKITYRPTTVAPANTNTFIIL